MFSRSKLHHKWNRYRYQVINNFCVAKIKYAWIIFKIDIYIKLFTRLYVRVGILFTCEKYLQEPIIPLRGEVWALKTSFTSMLFIEAPVPSQEGGGHVCGCQFCLFFDFVIGFWNCFAGSVVFFPLILLVIKHTSYQNIIYESWKYLLQY